MAGSSVNMHDHHYIIWYAELVVVGYLSALWLPTLLNWLMVQSANRLKYMWFQLHQNYSWAVHLYSKADMMFCMWFIQPPHGYHVRLSVGGSLQNNEWNVKNLESHVSNVMTIIIIINIIKINRKWQDQK